MYSPFDSFLLALVLALLWLVIDYFRNKEKEKETDE